MGLGGSPGHPTGRSRPSSPHPLARMWGGGIALGPTVKREAAPEGVKVMDVTANRF